ncbi:hypothetical protein UB37_12460 [Photobacterium iliopiscarium]|nr:hypothetical protein UB37_12460 [Photobacterium iliopiscarium]
MMSTLDKMNSQYSRSITTVTFQKYQLLKKNKNIITFFVEGEDDQFFYPMKARSHIPNQIVPLQCGGKDGVLEIWKLTKKDRLENNIKIGYFIDKDFDTPLSSDLRDYIYETPVYSVENLCFNKQTFINIYTEKFNMTPADNNYHSAITYYDTMSSDFFNSLLDINIWFYYQRKFNTDKNKTVKFPKKIPSGYLIYEENKISKNYNFDDLNVNNPNAIVIDTDNYSTCYNVVSNYKYEDFFRGKLHWSLFAYILPILVEDANDTTKQRFVNEKVKFTFTKNDPRKFFEEISIYSPCPPCLLQYFSKIAA